MHASDQIAPGVLAGLLRDLYLERRTGLLKVSRGGDHGSICFASGQIAWGESSIQECQLGPVLTRHGLVSQKALDEVASLVTHGKRLGSVLVEEGHLDATRLDEALGLHVRETLLTIFGWQDGRWEFEDLAPEYFADYAGALRIPTGDLILDAVWSVADPDVVRYQLGDLERPLALSTDPLLRFQKLTLSPTDGFFLSRVDGLRTAREVLEGAPVATAEGLRSLFGLLCTGLVEFVEEAPAAVAEPAAPAEPPPTVEEVLSLHRALPTRDHYALLGLATDASVAQVREATVARARRFNPESQSDPRVRDLRGQLEEICARLGEAERVLSDPRRRTEYQLILLRARLARSEQPAPAQAPASETEPTPLDPEAEQAKHEQLLGQVEQLLEEGRFWDALQAVDGVIGEMGDARSRLRSRARMLRIRIYLKNPKWRKESESLLRELIQEEPANAEAFFLLGQLYKQGGVSVRAAAMFRKVLELKPRHEGARAEVGSEPKPARGVSWLRRPK